MAPRLAWIAAILIVVLLGTAAATLLPARLLISGMLGAARTRAVSSEDVASVLDWATKQGVKPGTVASVAPPTAFVLFGADGPLDIAHLQDGRYCVLLTTEFFGHDNSNFRGVLSCTGPMKSGELQAAHGTYPPYVSIANCALPGCGVFEELYVERQRDDRTFDVAFDLN